MASAGGRAVEVGEEDKAGGERGQEGKGSTGASTPSGWALHLGYHQHLVASAWAGHRSSLLHGGRRAAWGLSKRRVSGEVPITWVGFINKVGLGRGFQD